MLHAPLIIRFFFIFFRTAMASSCTQLCLKCRSLLYSKTMANVWQYSAQVRHCTTVTRLQANILNGSSIINRGSPATACAKKWWKQQMFCYSDLSAKHVETEPKEDKDVDELSRTEAVASSKNPLVPFRDAVPVTESQTSFGTYYFTFQQTSGFHVNVINR